MTERQSGLWLVGLSTALSIGGVCVGVFLTGKEADGTRGGALALLVVIFAFFLRRDAEPTIRRALLETAPSITATLNAIRGQQATPSISVIDQLKAQLEALEVAAQVQRVSDRKANLRFGAAAAIGNFFWGFGDLIVQFIHLVRN
jgi:hypothetical protein